jgi:hypothetical protein
MLDSQIMVGRSARGKGRLRPPLVLFFELVYSGIQAGRGLPVPYGAHRECIGSCPGIRTLEGGLPALSSRGVGRWLVAPVGFLCRAPLASLVCKNLIKVGVFEACNV